MPEYSTRVIDFDAPVGPDTELVNLGRGKGRKACPVGPIGHIVAPVVDDDDDDDDVGPVSPVGPGTITIVPVGPPPPPLGAGVYKKVYAPILLVLPTIPVTPIAVGSSGNSG